MHSELSDRVLFVDDDEAVRRTFERSMKKASIPCDLAENADRAIELAHETDYCVIATDFAMPGKTGLELREALHELQPDATFVLITAQCTLELAIQATNEHAFTYVLTKPWRSAELHSLMNRAAEEAWERRSARTLAQRGVPPRPGADDRTALLAAVSSIVSQVCGAVAPDTRERTERFRMLAHLLCDALFVATDVRRDVDIAAVVLAAAVGSEMEHNPAEWLPQGGPFAGAQRALSEVDERWDGRGEPAGLLADQIDSGALLLALVRAFDAEMDHGHLTFDDAYRRARDRVMELAGKRLSPKVARALAGVDREQLRELYAPAANDLEVAAV
ncbi:MAG: response regulator [Myxococcota bacterium]